MIDDRLLAEFDRLILRADKGLALVTSDPLDIGPTPKDTIHSRRPLDLYHYRPTTTEVYRVPVLLVMATTNKGYIFDLAPGHSVVAFLLDRGYDVYMLDWCAVHADERHLDLEHYVLDCIPDCLARVAADSGQPDVSVIGYCAGGVMSVIHAATHRDSPLRNLVCLTTPVDFSHMKLFQAWTDRRFLDLDRLVDLLGNVPPELITATFEMLRPATRAASVIGLLDNLWNDDFVRWHRLLNRWAYDALPVAAEYFRQGVRELFWENSLCQGRFTLAGQVVDLARITVPIFHAVATRDHIAPRESTRPLLELVGSTDREEVVMQGGHMSVVAGPNAIRRLWPKVDAWLGVRST